MSGCIKLSLVLPCYNVEAYVDRALESLRAQTFTDFEIVAVDDGSTDGTAERLRRWLDVEPRLRIHKQDNRGLYLARLSGIAQSRGQWVTFMDADDELTPDHFEVLWAGTGEDVDVVVTGIAAVDVMGVERRYGPQRGDMLSTRAAIELLTGTHASGLYSCCNKLYRKSVLVGAGLDRPRINYGEDQIFNLRVFRSCRGRVRGVEGYTYRYIARPGSIMHSVSERHVDDFLELWRERDAAANALLREPGVWRRYRHQKMVNWMDFSGVVFRSRAMELMRRLQQGMEQTEVVPALATIDVKNWARWAKWQLRMKLGLRGRFPAWLA
ncbi:glycosyltransferase family 2 protein [Tepidimonas fonticaldi]|uniref:glycosyltransferase family 2 protein n=1 Tax=Tepidimonas fonticaldi TaxID=1101373 RepID=UPI0018D2E807|nr:glycosyltransferase family 2 protein [Tepidimonas fonticaldi]